MKNRLLVASMQCAEAGVGECGYKKQQERSWMELFCVLTGDGFMNLHVIKFHKTQTHTRAQGKSE